MAEERSNEIVIVDGAKGKTIAKLWWDGKEIKSDSAEFLARLRHYKDLEFSKSNKACLDRLLYRFKNGYMHAYKVGK